MPRRLLLSVLFAVLLAAQANAAISFVASSGASAGPTLSVSTLNVALGAAVATNDLIVVCSNITGSDFNGVPTDTLSTTYKLIKNNSNAGNGTRLGMWVGLAGGGGTPTITVNTNAATQISIAAGAWTGNNTTAPAGPSTCVQSGTDDGLVDACHTTTTTDVTPGGTQNHGGTDGGTDTALSITTGATTALIGCASFSATVTITIPTNYTNGGGTLTSQRVALAYWLNQAANTYTFADGSAWAANQNNADSVTTLIGATEAGGAARPRCALLGVCP